MIRSITRQPSATMARSIGCWRRMFHHELKGSVSDKEAKVEAILTLEGLEASHLKTLLPVVQRHFDSSLVELRKVVHKHLESNAVKGQVLVGTHSKVVLEGFDDSEKRTLRPIAEQRSSQPGDYELPNTRSKTFFKSIW